LELEGTHRVVGGGTEAVARGSERPLFRSARRVAVEHSRDRRKPYQFHGKRMGGERR
jgi:hypothetical protein